MPAYIKNTCTNCTECEKVCPTKAVLMGSVTYVIDTDLCNDCGICVRVCPISAIYMEDIKKAGAAMAGIPDNKNNKKK